MALNQAETDEKGNGTPIQRLMFLHDQGMREQEMYWSRFYSFATLSAGVFLLATSMDFDQAVIAFLGFLLSVAWVVVQFVGLGYVDRTKRVFHERRKALGFYYSYGKGRSEEDEQATPPGLLKYGRLSASNLGAYVSVGVLLFWAYTLAGLI